jgi:hypothetical protein
MLNINEYPPDFLNQQVHLSLKSLAYIRVPLLADREQNTRRCKTLSSENLVDGKNPLTNQYLPYDRTYHL